MLLFKKLKCTMLFLFSVLFVVMGCTGVYAADLADNIQVNGRLVQRISINTSDPVETPKDEGGEFNMIRTTVYGEMNGFFDIGNFTIIGRIDRELMPDYLKTLDEMSGADLSKLHNNEELREYYVDFDASDRVSMRLGRQQVVWGRTDFFQGLDILHGYDYTWNSFLEGSNEYTRKPSTMANIQIAMPEADGRLQLIWRPGGLDDSDNIGNTYDTVGGRWATQPNKGFDFDTDGSIPSNYHADRGDADDDDFGFRWMSQLGQMEYSLSYYHGHMQNPVMNAKHNPYGSLPENDFELIFPEIDLIGLTANYYIARPLDIVIRTEISYTFDKPYNVGRNFFGGGLPGGGGVEEFDTIRTVVSFDKNAAFVQTLFGASRPGFLTMQIFDTWLVDYDKDKDDIVDNIGYGGAKAEHSTIVTYVLNWNYDHDNITLGMAGGFDTSHGDQFIFPSADFVFGNHWRLHFDYVNFYSHGDVKMPGEVETRTHMFGFFDNQDRFHARLTYLF